MVVVSVVKKLLKIKLKKISFFEITHEIIRLRGRHSQNEISLSKKKYFVLEILKVRLTVSF